LVVRRRPKSTTAKHPGGIFSLDDGLRNTWHGMIVSLAAPEAAARAISACGSFPITGSPAPNCVMPLMQCWGLIAARRRVDQP
jgi:hypothetical protein